MTWRIMDLRAIYMYILITRARYYYVAVKYNAEAKNNPSAISNYDKIYKVERIVSRCVSMDENKTIAIRRRKNPALWQLALLNNIIIQVVGVDSIARSIYKHISIISHSHNKLKMERFSNVFHNMLDFRSYVWVKILWSVLYFYIFLCYQHHYLPLLILNCSLRLSLVI